ncbi:hypothetical protein [Priestia megaterium]|uniref:Uncharacterized protein n=1 Tax=Priestia megaterium TaxID=1404 RepID=A0ABD4WXG5_PRIMG|nr:hypothetical protein [Priestia megaterium]MBV6737754.1 hypothetical protein [Priestia megaterium]MDD9784641.1 hypothetical protein [Priestia megaterium]QLC90848.1 hypothetical protein HW576_30415 [Priestia megaterium]
MDEKEKEKEQSDIEKPSLDRAGMRSFMGNPEKFEFSFYGIFMACLPLIIVGIVIWYFW